MVLDEKSLLAVVISSSIVYTMDISKCWAIKDGGRSNESGEPLDWSSRGAVTVAGSRMVHGVEKPSIVPSVAELRKLLFVVEALLRGMNLFQLVGLSGTRISADIEPGGVTTCSSDIIVVVSDPSPLITEWDIPWSCV
jgi:hypothetical protein